MHSFNHFICPDHESIKWNIPFLSDLKFKCAGFPNDSVQFQCKSIVFVPMIGNIVENKNCMVPFSYSIKLSGKQNYSYENQLFCQMVLPSESIQFFGYWIINKNCVQYIFIWIISRQQVPFDSTNFAKLFQNVDISRLHHWLRRYFQAVEWWKSKPKTFFWTTIWRLTVIFYRCYKFIMIIFSSYFTPWSKLQVRHRNFVYFEIIAKFNQSIIPRATKWCVGECLYWRQWKKVSLRTNGKQNDLGIGWFRNFK